LAKKEYSEEKKMICPMCELSEKFQKADPDNPNKTQCTGCGVKFFNRERR